MQGMLIASLNSDFQATGQHRVFFVKPNSVSSYFSLLVGDERTSCRNIAEQIMKINDISLDNVWKTFPSFQPSICNRITIPVDLISKYNAQNPVVQNEIATLLLDALIFYDIEILN